MAIITIIDAVNLETIRQILFSAIVAELFFGAYLFLKMSISLKERLQQVKVEQKKAGYIVIVDE